MPMQIVNEMQTVQPEKESPQRMKSPKALQQPNQKTR